MSMWTIIVIVVLTGIAAYAGNEFARWYRQRGVGVRAAIEAREQDIIDRLRTDPSDALQAYVTAGSLRIQQLSQAVETAATKCRRKRAETARITDAFPGGVLPSRTRIIQTWAFLLLWVVAVSGLFFLDFPIWQTVLGGNKVYAFVATLIFLAAPFCAATLIILVRHRAVPSTGGGTQTSLSSRAVIAGILIALAAIVTLMVCLSPVRAQVEYGGQIAAAEQQLAAYQNDPAMKAQATLEAGNLAALKEQEQQSATVNGALILVASLLEFATSHAVTRAIQLQQHRTAKRAELAAEDELAQAKNDLSNEQRRQLMDVSRLLPRAGVTQGQLASALNDGQPEPTPPPSTTTTTTTTTTTETGTGPATGTVSSGTEDTGMSGTPPRDDPPRTDLPPVIVDPGPEETAPSTVPAQEPAAGPAPFIDPFNQA